MFLILAFATILPFFVTAQTKIEGHWGKEYLNVSYSAASCSDGGFILTGLTKNGINNNYGDIVVIKLDSVADTQWTFTYGGPFLEGGNCVIQTTDGGYLVSGHTQDFGAVDCDAFMLKLDAIGNHQWFKIFGSYADDIAEGTIQLPDGGYIFTGITESYGNIDTSSRNRHIYFVRTTATGDSVWTHYYAGAGNEYGYSIARMLNGDFLAVGWTTSRGAGEKAGWLCRLNGAGDTLWTRIYKSDTGDTKFLKILPTQDNGFIIAGGTHEPLNSMSSVYSHSQGFIVKVDSAGNELWTKTIGQVTDGIELRSVAELPNGNLLFTGASFVHDSTGNAYILTTDAFGNKLNDTTTGGIQSYANSVCLHGAVNYLIAGQTSTYGNPFGDIYWMEMIEPSTGVAQIKANGQVFYPNPMVSESVIRLPSSETSQTVTLEVRSADGRLVLYNDNISASELQLSATTLHRGMYLYKVSCRDGHIFLGSFMVE